MQPHRRHRVHRGIRNQFDRHGNIKVPHAHRLVVARRDEATVVIDEGDGVDRSEVLIVLLGDLAGTDVVLRERRERESGEYACFSEKHAFDRRFGRTVMKERRKGETHLNDLLVAHTRQEHVLVRRVGVELDTVRDLAVRERLFRLTCAPTPICHQSSAARESRAEREGGRRRRRNAPVSVSQSFICRSNAADKNSEPELLNVTSWTAFE